jgi:uncharacterized protein YdeI (YjbR/CyaY-like superfamily)
MTQPLDFAKPTELRRWFAKHHATAPELWLRIYKKDSGVATVTYAEALDQALCYGWIDAIKKSYDADSWVQRFCPRSARSRWSKINVQHVKRLTRAGKMAAPGLAAVRAAQEDGRWGAAYDSSATGEVPKELLVALKQSKKAHAFFKTLDRANLYAITYRIQTAKKPKTRERWIARIVEMLANGKVFHPKK